MPSSADNLTDALLGPILAADPAGPRVTYYDDASGERIELSTSTLMNWAAKTANMVRDEFALEPGAKVAVLLPAHWQSVAVLLGVWWAGCEVVLSPESDAELAFVTADRLDDVADVPEVAALSLDAFGKGLSDLPIGVADYATSIRVHGDQFRAAGAGAALEGRSVAETVRAATESAAARELASSDRVMSSASWDSAEELIGRLLSVLAAGASLVQVAHPDADATARRVGTEKVTKQF
ncbi:TIGR03089 family protein [Rhodococcus globerulus]|uniref:TIGR03089 family protein n=1 Tax=Rhodococcus globerulus TaxID=33008 RepID=UPI0039E833BF